MADIKISLAAARKNANLTQERVANELRVSKQTIVNWENGKTIPTFATLETLSRMYKIPIDNIFLPKKGT